MQVRRYHISQEENCKIVPLLNYICMYRYVCMYVCMYIHNFLAWALRGNHLFTSIPLPRLLLSFFDAEKEIISYLGSAYMHL